MRNNNFNARNSNNKLGGIFKQYFSRLNGTSSAALTKEILHGLTECLAKDPSCFDTWNKIHPSQVLKFNFFAGTLSTR